VFRSLQSKLSIRQAALTVAAALLLSGLFTAGQVAIGLSDERQLVRDRLSQVIAAVEGPAGQAAFEFDRQLARDVVAGLMAYEPIRTVVLSDDVGRALAQESRERSEPPSALVAALFGNMAPVVAPLETVRPTGDPMPVGQLTVTLDPTVVAEGFLDRIGATVTARSADRAAICGPNSRASHIMPGSRIRGVI